MTDTRPTCDELDDLARELLACFPVADDQCTTTDEDGRRCGLAAWHTDFADYTKDHDFTPAAPGGEYSHA